MATAIRQRFVKYLADETKMQDSDNEITYKIFNIGSRNFKK